MSIETQELIIGAAPTPILKTASAWAREHQAELIAKWRELDE